MLRPAETSPYIVFYLGLLPRVQRSSNNFERWYIVNYIFHPANLPTAEPAPTSSDIGTLATPGLNPVSLYSISLLPITTDSRHPLSIEIPQLSVVALARGIGLHVLVHLELRPSMENDYPS
jgi:hypothetical protein